MNTEFLDKSYSFKTGNPGRPKGVLNKTTSLKKTLQDCLDRNIDKIIPLLDELVSTTQGLKWFLELKATLEPKTQEQGTQNVVVVFRDGKPDTTGVDCMVRSPAQAEAIPG